jgi:hypothetical protein
MRIAIAVATLFVLACQTPEPPARTTETALLQKAAIEQVFAARVAQEPPSHRADLAAVDRDVVVDDAAGVVFMLDPQLVGRELWRAPAQGQDLFRVALPRCTSSTSRRMRRRIICRCIRSIAPTCGSCSGPARCRSCAQVMRRRPIRSSPRAKRAVCSPSIRRRARPHPRRCRATARALATCRR